MSALDLSLLYQKLNAESASDLLFWSQSELSGWATDALAELARTTGAHIERFASIAVAAGDPTYALPSRLTSIIHISLNDQALRYATVRELEALDADWQATTGTPARYTRERGFTTVRLYPKPTGSGTLQVIGHTTPESSSNVRVAAPVLDAVLFRVLAKARAKRGDGAMPDTAQQSSAVVELLVSAIRGIWGEGH